jgi:hypothetical protein
MKRVIAALALVFVLAAVSSVSAFETVDPKEIVFNNEGDPIVGAVSLNLQDNNMTILAFNVYDASGAPIGTITSWNYTGHDVVNITSSPGSQTFEVLALAAGTAVLTVKSTGDTKTITNSTTIKVTATSAPAKTNQTKSSSKGFIPGYEALPVLGTLAIAALVLRRKLRLNN